MRLLITGARGLLGTELVDRASRLGLEVHATDIDEMDVTDRGAVESVVGSLEPEVILHCAAYTAVDRAEEEPDAAMRVNRDGTRNVARAAAAAGSLLVYLSTDYVFDGEKRSPYLPEDPPNPQGAYARSKLAGEEETAAAGGEWLMVRSGWLYGSGGKNFVDTILGMAEERGSVKVVSDQKGRPTWAGSLAPTVLDLLATGARGIYHVADRGEATWLELA
ncbi:MAG: dTDP-4-dehydrorhamnose reductase, partial [Gemmatimonadetes bacterium]|nr:dTDP-4-dehydrorhamnose reductase [Gemmatimonadota bacterium]